MTALNEYLKAVAMMAEYLFSMKIKPKKKRRSITR